MSINAVRFCQPQQNYGQAVQQPVSFSGTFQKPRKALIIPVILAALVSPFAHSKKAVADIVEITTKYLANGNACEQVQRRFDDFGNLTGTTRQHFNNLWERFDYYGRRSYHNVRGCAGQETNVVTDTYRVGCTECPPPSTPPPRCKRHRHVPDFIWELPPYRYYGR